MKHLAPKFILLFLGPQGAGKGTQATLLAQRLGVPAISTGALYRTEIEQHTRLGRLVERDVARGELVADEITNALVGWRLQQKDVCNGVVLDGYPRTLAQSAALELLGVPVEVVAFTVTDEVAIARISGRRICRSCGKSFHRIYLPSTKNGVCDTCGGTLYQRSDDTPRSVKKRLAVYHKNTEPILAIFDRMSALHEIDGTKDVKTITKDVWQTVGKKYLKKV